MKGLHSLRRVGLLIGLAILLIPLLSTAQNAPTQASETAPNPLATPVDPPEDGSLTITARMCPEGYEGNTYDVDCTGIPRAGSDFSILLKDGSSIGADIDENGVAMLALPAEETPGSVRLNFGLVGLLHDVDWVVFCVDEEGKRVPVSKAPHRIDVAVSSDGKAISCAWYFIPDWIDPGDPGTVAFVNRLCPPGYEGTDYATDCVTPAGEGKTFGVRVHLPNGERIAVQDRTGPDGVMTIGIPFPDLVLPGAIYLYQWVCERCGEDPAELDPFVATCTRHDGAEAVPIRVEGPNSIAVDALVDDAITCTWYNLPPAE